MADATGYDPKNISGITTLYVTPNATAPIYKNGLNPPVHSLLIVQEINIY